MARLRHVTVLSVCVCVGVNGVEEFQKTRWFVADIHRRM